MIRLPKMIAYSPFLLFLGERLANIGPRMDGREESIIPSAYVKFCSGSCRESQ